MIYKTDDVRISGIQEVLPPEVLHNEFPMSETEISHLMEQLQTQVLHIHDIEQDGEHWN